MFVNNSPWIKQLNRTRPVVPIDTSITTDVTVVGGGIAGTMTAYFTLRNTDHKVVMVEADKVAHGATGHNAGQIVSYFERSFTDLVQEFGVEMAGEGQGFVESAWGLLDAIHKEAQLTTPIHRFTGHAACMNYEQILLHLEDNYNRQQAGLDLEDILIAEEAYDTSKIPAKYTNLYALISQEFLLSLLETDNKEYIASVSYMKGCTNSALLCEELIGYMLKTYPSRFSLYEGSPVDTVTLHQDKAVLSVLTHTITTNRVVLCTNGFENFKVVNATGTDINTKFHHLVNGTIGYMAAYFELPDREPTAISYYSEQTYEETVPYFYLTRRPHEHEKKLEENLICIGGPEQPLPEVKKYTATDPYVEHAKESMDKFLKQNYRYFKQERTEYAFFWHGLMGYTPNKVRCIGAEACNPVLMYNLGCNGVGILPSIYGGKRISQLLAGQNIPPSMFDPKDQRCLLNEKDL